MSKNVFTGQILYSPPTSNQQSVFVKREASGLLSPFRSSDPMEELSSQRAPCSRCGSLNTSGTEGVECLKLRISKMDMFQTRISETFTFREKRDNGNGGGAVVAFNRGDITWLQFFQECCVKNGWLWGKSRTGCQLQSPYRSWTSNG